MTKELPEISQFLKLQAEIPEPAFVERERISSEVERLIGFLSSEEALLAVELDSYWPKWDTPGWHMLLLHEMGEGGRIPGRMIEAYVAALGRMPVQSFPIHPGDLPPGVDPYRGAPCHCQLGDVYQVLAGWGVDVDRKLPWIRPWFLRYQMQDGGLSCDSGAYLVKDECPSSMVGTIAVFEAVLLHMDRPWSTEEEAFLRRGAQFLMDRKLMLGSPTRYNAEEREDEAQWLRPCFPRFYFYDVLRGLNALLIWAEKMDQAKIPFATVVDVASHLASRFPDGVIRNERLCFDGVSTLAPTSSGEWVRREEAFLFPLLQEVSAVGRPSPFLSRQWAQARRRMIQLYREGKLG